LFFSQIAFVIQIYEKLPLFSALSLLIWQQEELRACKNNLLQQSGPPGVILENRPVKQIMKVVAVVFTLIPESGNYL